MIKLQTFCLAPALLTYYRMVPFGCIVRLYSISKNLNRCTVRLMYIPLRWGISTRSNLAGLPFFLRISLLRLLTTLIIFDNYFNGCAAQKGMVNLPYLPYCYYVASSYTLSKELVFCRLTGYLEQRKRT